MKLRIGPAVAGEAVLASAALPFPQRTVAILQASLTLQNLCCLALMLLYAAIGTAQTIGPQEKARLEKELSERRSQLVKNRALLDAFNNGNEASSKANE